MKTSKNVRVKNSNHTRKHIKQPRKKYVILFDLDETLGHFQHISMFFDDEIHKNPKNNKKEIIFKLLDENPSSFRIHLFSLLSFLKREKQRNKNITVALFTNNQGPKYWYNSIVEYLNNKMNYQIFDKVIGPYKIGSYQVEPQRTSHNKSILDISRILNTDLKRTKYIMFDDQYHSNMEHKRVKFIHINEYLPKDINPEGHIDGTYEREHIKIMKELRDFLPKHNKKHQKTKRNKNTNTQMKMKTQKNHKKTIKNSDTLYL